MLSAKWRPFCQGGDELIGSELLLLASDVRLTQDSEWESLLNWGRNKMQTIYSNAFSWLIIIVV